MPGPWTIQEHNLRSYTSVDVWSRLQCRYGRVSIASEPWTLALACELHFDFCPLQNVWIYL